MSLPRLMPQGSGGAGPTSEWWCHLGTWVKMALPTATEPSLSTCDSGTPQACLTFQELPNKVCTVGPGWSSTRPLHWVQSWCGRATGIGRKGLSATPQADVWRGMLHSGKMVSLGGMEERPSTGTLTAVTQTLYLQPHHSVFPCMTLVHS